MNVSSERPRVDLTALQMFPSASSLDTTHMLWSHGTRLTVPLAAYSKESSQSYNIRPDAGVNGRVKVSLVHDPLIPDWFMDH